MGGDLRPLPWRRTLDPWAVLVSEVMLQQTQVSRVVGPYRAFVRAFPTPAGAAAASPAALIRAWAGLGYHRRALALQAAARRVVERHGGAVPSSLGDLLALPGVGPYTARAVRCFAFGLDGAVVDTNVRRVLARSVVGRPLADTEAQALAEHLAPAGRAWAWNQAMVDIGARWCTWRAPRCDDCPLRRPCRWRQSGYAGGEPARPASRQSRFEGSDRQGRGRLLAALRRGPVARASLAAACGWPDDPGRAERAAASLVRDGLALAGDDGRLRLPPAPVPGRPATARPGTR